MSCSVVFLPDAPFLVCRQTRNGKQRFAIPKPYGQCIFVNDASYEELYKALDVHKALIKEKYGSGDGVEVCTLLSLLYHTY